MKYFKKIVYSKYISNLLKMFLSLFYDKKYLTDKFFEKHRIGYFWAIKDIPRRFIFARQGVKWPIGKNVQVSNGKNIHFHNSSLNIFQQSGCYYQGFGKITIGKNVWIARNVGIITANHLLTNPEEHEEPKEVYISDSCWIGMNSVLLPGVILGKNTIVGAGSIVSKSFPEGNVVIAGNPAKVIKTLVND